MACPCCSGLLLRHIGHGEVYWYCQNCRQEMPDQWAKHSSAVFPLDQVSRSVPRLELLSPN